MKTNLIFLMLLISITSLAQECPCVKAAVLGQNSSSSVIHNNSVVAMDDLMINYGESVSLFTKYSMGKTIWYKDGKLLTETKVNPTETTEYEVKSVSEGCPEVSAKVIIKVSREIIDNDAEDVTVYPNPTNDFVTVSAKNVIKSIRFDNLAGGNCKDL